MDLEHPVSGPPPAAGTGAAASPRIRRAIALPLSDDDQGGAAASDAVAAAAPAAAPGAVVVPAPAASPPSAQANSSVQAGSSLAGRLFRPDTWRPRSAASPAAAEAATGEAVLTGSLAEAVAEGRTRKPSHTATASHGLKPGTWSALAAAAFAGAVLVSVPLVHHHDNKTRTDFEGLDHSAPVKSLTPDGGNAKSGGAVPDGYASDMPVHDLADGTSTPRVPEPKAADKPSRSVAGARPGRTETAVVPGTGAGSDTSTLAHQGVSPQGRSDVPGTMVVPGTAAVPGTGTDLIPGTAGTPSTQSEALPDGTPSVRIGVPIAPLVPSTDATKPTTAPAVKPTTAPADTQHGLPKADSKFPVLTFGTTAPTHTTAAKPAMKAETPHAATPKADAPKAEPKSTVKETSSPLSADVPAAKAIPRTSVLTPAVPAKPAVPAHTVKQPDATTVAPKSTDTPTPDATPTDTTAPDATPTDTPTADATPTDTATPDATDADTNSADATSSGSDSTADPNAQWSTKVIHSTYVLKSGQSIASNRMRITMRHHGDMVISDEHGNVVWSSHTKGRDNEAVFQDDGHFVVYSHSGDPLWSSGTAGNPGAELVIQDDGNVTILSASGDTLWASGTVG